MIENLTTISSSVSSPSHQQEGWEYEAFDHILAEEFALPEQISFELHYLPLVGGVSWKGRERTTGELAMFSVRLYEAGYRVVSREDNPLGDRPCATELTIVRFKCPPSFA